MTSSHLGMGVMLNMLGGDRGSLAAYQAAQGKQIESVVMEGDALRFAFADGTRLTLRDDGQSCCESRYMRTDDDLTRFAGATLIDVELRDAPDVEEESGEVHEVQFLVVSTSLGAFTCSTHNEHNGYYGGFYIKASAS